ncbi:MAG: DUF721 domain-containing protein [Acidobacteriota bacterium]|nr:DUF721 domain-containing protein [Acidobacteriota bacterium]
MQRSADFATSVLAEMLERQPMTPGKLQFAWRAAVGPALARAASLDIRHGRVFVRASSPQWKRELERSRPMILERLRVLLGREAVTRLEIE